MKITAILILTTLVFNLDLNGQSRTIYGRVISEDLAPLPEVNIQNMDTVLLGKTDIDGQFKIDIDKETDKLLLSWIGMEWTEVKLQADCDTIEVVMMYDVIYDFMSAKKIDRLRKKRFDDLYNIQTKAFLKGLFTKNTICYKREFKPNKPTLDSMNRELKSKRKQIKIAFKEFAIGDTVIIPYGGDWRYDGTDRTTLHPFSYVVDGKNFPCIIKGVITEKSKHNNGYNLVYRVIDYGDCSYDRIVLNGMELKVGDLIEYNMKHFKVLNYR